jgi:hypothetical protein
VDRVHQEHGTDFDFISLKGASTMGASSEHGRSGIMTLGSYNVGMSMSTDDAASKAVVRQDHGGSVVDVITK